VHGQGDDVSITTINVMDGHNVMASGQRQHHLVEMHGHGVVPQALGVERAAAGQREPRCARRPRRWAHAGDCERAAEAGCPHTPQIRQEPAARVGLTV
jgi:hypothetical protein